MSASIVWFRLDLRIEDNPALHAAVKRGAPIVPLFVWSPGEEGPWQPGAASRYWLHQSLVSLSAQLSTLGAPLLIRRAERALDAIESIVDESGADAVFWNRRYEPALIARDTHIKAMLRERGIQVDTFNSALLIEPWDIANKQGAPFQVFTPFWKSCLARTAPPPPLPAPSHITPAAAPIHSAPLESLALEPRIDWAGGIRDAWTPGEDGAHAQLAQFISQVDDYTVGRDRPDMSGTSRLSPHLHFGEIGPRQIWHTLTASTDPSDGAPAKFLSEIGWREFAHHLLFHFPHTTDTPLRQAFERFPWADDASLLYAWQHGRTGYPIVDAGMRELWHTGWMHNRVRMIVASFLTKDLLIPWQAGARWFWDTLVDADLASNTLGWQWTAGCGADAAPYFRIFNPVSQGEKFDPNGDYVRAWIPELATLDSKWLQRPWEAPANVLASAGVTLGANYPLPIVDHAKARATALQAFAAIKS